MNKKFLILMYAAHHTVTVEGGEVRQDVDHDKIREVAQKMRPADGVLMLRSAEAFDGIVETLEGSLPDAVLFVGDGPSIDRAGKAFEEAEVRIDQVPYAVFIESASQKENGETNDAFGGDIDLLKARAVELKVTFPSRIGYAALLSKVRDAEAELT